MRVAIGCIVEGHGETEAIPLLIRRIAGREDPQLVVDIHTIRVSGSALRRQDQLERAVELVARRVGGRGAVLLVLDSDDDCPAQLGPALLHRAVVAREDLPVGVVLANREFEAWFLAAAESLRGRCGLPEDLCSPPDPEAIRGAKEWLTRHMPPGHRYSETEHQARLAALFDLDVALRAASFEKCYREVARLLAAARRFG